MMVRFIRKWFLLVFTWIWAFPLSANNEMNFFPVPDGLEKQVQFWVDIFTKYSIYQQIIHDADKPERIYRVVDLNDILSYSEITRGKVESFVESEKNKVISILKKLASGKMDVNHLSEEELRIYRLFGPKPERQTIQSAVDQVRVQGGMWEAFVEGIIRSGRYLEEIRKILRKHGVPQELAYLPHVESSFNPHAYSKYGAVGIWQFTRATGKRYLKIGKDVDERRDPILSTGAAAKLLRTNYRSLGSWPLAIMAYNRGLGGIRRAVQKLRTKDAGTIIRNYSSRRFGFASKNFYPEFLAAVRIAQNAAGYFGTIQVESPLRLKTVKLPIHYPLDSVLTAYNVTIEDLKSLNPALRPSIFKEKKMIPKGYHLRLPQPRDIFADSEALEVRTNRQGFGLGALATIAQTLKAWAGVLFPSTPNRESYSDETEYAITLLSESGGEVLPNPGDSNSEQEKIWAERMSPMRDQNIDGINDLLTANMSSMEVEGMNVVVLPGETLGHYADWLNIPTQSLRRLNGLRFGQSIRVGQRLLLNFWNVTPTTFEMRRLAFHRQILMVKK